MHKMNFQPIPRIVRLSAALLAGVLFTSAGATLNANAAATLPRIDLTGVIKSASAPIEGAHVFIYTAGPRVGPGDI